MESILQMLKVHKFTQMKKKMVSWIHTGKTIHTNPNRFLTDYCHTSWFQENTQTIIKNCKKAHNILRLWEHNWLHGIRKREKYNIYIHIVFCVKVGHFHIFLQEKYAVNQWDLSLSRFLHNNPTQAKYSAIVMTKLKKTLSNYKNMQIAGLLMPTILTNSFAKHNMDYTRSTISIMMLKTDWCCLSQSVDIGSPSDYR